MAAAYSISSPNCLYSVLPGAASCQKSDGNNFVHLIPSDNVESVVFVTRVAGGSVRNVEQVAADSVGGVFIVDYRSFRYLNSTGEAVIFLQCNQ